MEIVLLIIIILLVIFFVTKKEPYSVGNIFAADGDNIKSGNDFYRMENGLLRKFASNEVWEAQPNRRFYVAGDVSCYPKGCDISTNNVAGIRIDGLLLKERETGQLYLVVQHSWGWYKKWRIAPDTWKQFGGRAYANIDCKVIQKLPGNAYWPNPM